MRFLVFLILSFHLAAAFSAEVNVYSARKEALIKPLLERFTEQSGIEVNLITGTADALIKRMEVEGAHSPADVLITVDAARLYRAKEKQLLQSVDAEQIISRVPQNYRDEENQWFGLSLRSRVIVYAKDKVNPSSLSSYENLVDEKWKQKLCVRSSSNIYNQSLVASLVAHHGIEETENWSRALVKNFARSPKGGDRDQIKAVAAGQCDLALVNTYYVGGMIDSNVEADQNAVSKVAVFWPNQDDRGAHVNLSGIGMTRSAKHREEAIKLIEFLLSDESQQWYAEVNYEYPVVEKISNNDLKTLWGEFRADDINMSLLGKHNADAVLLMDRAGWK